MNHMIGLKQTCSIKNVTLKAAKKLWVSPSTGKSSTTALTNSYMGEFDTPF